LGDPEFQIPGTKETGRLHFFYHCPKSELPIRDVLGIEHEGSATEPHIEKCAENYCWPCDPMNIRGFLRSEEKYLFLFTTCRNARLYGRRLVVGYIRKQGAFFCKGHGRTWWCVQGATRLVSFGDAYELDRSVGGRHHSIIRRRKLDEAETALVMSRLKRGRNILRKCIAEVTRLSDHAGTIS
jgi:hypothetical protein